MNLPELPNSFVQFDLAMVGFLGGVVTWPVVFIGLIGLGLAVFGETYQETEGDEKRSILGRIGHRRITGIGLTALSFLMAAFGLGAFNQYTMIREAGKEREALINSQDPRILRLPEVGTGTAVPNEPLTYRWAWVVDDTKRTKRFPLIAKGGDVIEYEADCPMETVDWTCRYCGFEFGAGMASVHDNFGAHYQVSRDSSTAKDHILLSGWIHLWDQMQPGPITVNGFGTCTKVNVRLRGKRSSPNPT